MKATPCWVTVYPFNPMEINIINGVLAFVPINEVEHGAAYALNRWQFEFHGAGISIHRLATPAEHLTVSMLCVFHSKRHTACRWAMFFRVITRVAVLFVIAQ